MENKLPVIEEQLASIDNGFSRQVNSISNRISDLELNLGELQEKINLWVFSNKWSFLIIGEQQSQFVIKLIESSKFHIPYH